MVSLTANGKAVKNDNNPFRKYLEIEIYVVNNSRRLTTAGGKTRHFEHIPATVSRRLL